MHTHIAEWVKSQIKLNRGIPVPFALYKPHIPVYISHPRSPEGTWEGTPDAGGSVMSHDTGGGGPGRVRRQDGR
jgi:hypothetical protein